LAGAERYADYLADFVGYVKGRRAAGQSVDDAAAAYQVPARFNGYTAPPARVKPDVQVIYDDLSR
jgi:hypothetical protein